MFSLALSSHIYFLLFETPIVTFCLLAPRNTWCGNACFGTQVSLKYGTWYSERVILQLMRVGSWAALHIFATQCSVTSPKKGETAVHCCDPALSVLIMLVSWNVFHVVSAFYTFFLADQISCRSFAGSVYRMRSLAVSHPPTNSIRESASQGVVNLELLI